VVAGEKSGSRTAVFAGLFAGALIGIMRYGVYHSIDITPTDLDSLTMLTILGIVLDLFVVLAGLLCGYVVSATASRTWPVRKVFQGAFISCVIAGLINLMAMVLIYFPQTSVRLSYDVMNLGLYGIWYFVQIVVLSMAGAVIYLTLVRKPRHLALHGWKTGLVVGIVAAIAVALNYYVLSLLVESFHGLVISSSPESLIIQFAVDGLVLVAGALAGFVTASLIRRSVSTPANYVLCTALAGFTAGFFGILASMLILNVNFLSELNGYDWLNVAMQILYGAVLLMALATGGGVYYALWHGEIGLLSGPGESEKQP
jgi:hypothetical protein